ncbi:MAG: enoyl-CoA hydratase-related protein [Planctomycetota bacterium]|nr:enoyl-CoA hydratase-related protein [Planctomycetota bacterium]
MSEDSVRTEIRDRLAIVTVDRPKSLNALNGATLDALSAAAKRLRADPEVGAVILTGAGEKAFIAGADIAELKDLDASTGTAASRKGQSTFSLFENLTKPVIAAVNGFALGGGCELALACHIRLASENARFGLPEVKLGIIPGYGGTQRLARVVGLGRAMEMILSGEMISAQEAFRIGLVNRVYPSGELMAAAESLARTILSRAPTATRFALDAILDGINLDIAAGLEIEAEQFGLACGTTDKIEGMVAFLEKREAKFEGK